MAVAWLTLVWKMYPVTSVGVKVPAATVLLSVFPLMPPEVSCASGCPPLGACMLARAIPPCCIGPCRAAKWSPQLLPCDPAGPSSSAPLAGPCAFPGVFVPKPALLSSFSPGGGGEVTQAVASGGSSALSTLSRDLCSQPNGPRPPGAPPSGDWLVLGAGQALCLSPGHHVPVMTTAHTLELSIHLLSVCVPGTSWPRSASAS